MDLILASTSPRRREYLALLGLPFRVVPSDFDESQIAEKHPETLVESLAKAKARRVAEQSGTGLVIGADTVVVKGDTILEKPKDRNDARQMLALLSATEHSVFTGLSLVDAASGRIKTGHARTLVRMKPYGPDTIERYLDCGEYTDKAGAYAIQGRGVVLVSGITGDFYNVVGLPLGLLSDYLEEFGLLV